MLKRIYEGDAENLYDHQLVEASLFYPISRKDTNETAHLLLDNAGGLEQMLYAPPEKHTEVMGVGKYTATFIYLVGIIARRSALASAVRHSLDSKFRRENYLFAWYKGKPHGTVAATFLDARLKVIETVTLAAGRNFRADEINPELCRAAMDCSATYAILSHNHPRAHRRPSVEDSYLTRSAENALHLAECTLLAHYIVTEDDVVLIEI